MRIVDKKACIFYTIDPILMMLKRQNRKEIVTFWKRLLDELFLITVPTIEFPLCKKNCHSKKIKCWLLTHFVTSSLSKQWHLLLNYLSDIGFVTNRNIPLLAHFSVGSRTLESDNLASTCLLVDISIFSSLEISQDSSRESRPKCLPENWNSVFLQKINPSFFEISKIKVLTEGNFVLILDMCTTTHFMPQARLQREMQRPRRQDAQWKMA